MNNRESVISWIQGLPEYTKSEFKKCKLLHQEQQLAGPIASLETSDKNRMVSTPKRRRLEGSDSGLGPDATPHAFLAGTDSLLQSIEEIGRCVNILPYCMKSTVEKKVADLGALAKPWSTSFQSPENADDLPGCIPSFEEKINAMLCNTARPSKYFKPTSPTGQLIDTCIYKTVEQDEGLTNKITRFCADSQTNNSINHTDYNPLRTRPLLLSIKSTKPETGKEALLQIGVWYSTQWSFLRWAVGQRLKKRAKLEAHETTAEVEADTLASLSRLAFIPGIIVHGHRWCMVLSTYDGKKTTLWGEHQFGTTSSFLGTFCAIAGIRRLTAWANDHYWPWFEKNVLD
ncbi:hypothetical protein GGS24DRAFT_488149 [Hypoxylon argillaceum]|nr:hypothetical protein GGS24DRAFT_488149 [Hypoxylon argillaceum]